MVLIEEIEKFKNDGLALTIGFFDGVHAGHRFLLEQLIKIAQKEGLHTAVLTFWPHPRLVLNEEYKPRLLNSFAEKIKLLEQQSIDYCIKMNFTPELAAYSAGDFMKKILQEKLCVKHLLIGYDHRFGKNREETFDDYFRYGKETGIAVTQASSYEENGRKISSSFIRKLLDAGDVKPANYYLNYPFTLKGIVEEGTQLGRKIGFPTANLRLSFAQKYVPAAGVYAVWIDFDEKRYEGMLYIGNRPTVTNSGVPSIEVNLFDFEGDLYNRELSITFADRTRGQEKFSSIAHLQTQLRQDKEKVKEILALKNGKTVR